jgi:hypothetical protein
VGIATGVFPPVLSTPLISSTSTLPPIGHCQSFLASLRDVFFRIGFRLARDRHPPDCRHPHSLLSLFFLLLLLLVFFFLILHVFACFSIAISLYVFFRLFLLFDCFSIFVILFPCTFFSFLFLLVIRLYPIKLFSAHEYIYIWSRLLGYGCERYPGFRVEKDEYWIGGSLPSKPRNKCYYTYALDGVCLVQI